MEGEGEVIPGKGVHIYEEGTQVTLKATPAEEWKFQGWIGDIPEDQGDQLKIEIEINQDKSIKANFRAKEEEERQIAEEPYMAIEEFYFAIDKGNFEMAAEYLEKEKRENFKSKIEEMSEEKITKLEKITVYYAQIIEEEIHNEEATLEIEVMMKGLPEFEPHVEKEFIKEASVIKQEEWFINEEVEYLIPIDF